MRLFLAIEPDAAARQTIADVSARLKSAMRDESRELTWTAAENVHITVHFLGEIDEARADGLVRGLAEPLPQSPFLASLGPAGLFPDRGAPRVIWIGVNDGRDAMGAAHAELGARLGRLGLAVEARPLSPHFTIARARARARLNGRRVAGFVRDLVVPPASWQVDRVTLFRSHLSSDAPHYESLLQIRFGAG